MCESEEKDFRKNSQFSSWSAKINWTFAYLDSAELQLLTAIYQQSIKFSLFIFQLFWSSWRLSISIHSGDDSTLLQVNKLANDAAFTLLSDSLHAAIINNHNNRKLPIFHRKRSGKQNMCNSYLSFIVIFLLYFEYIVKRTNETFEKSSHSPHPSCLLPHLGWAIVLWCVAKDLKTSLACNERKGKFKKTIWLCSIVVSGWGMCNRSVLLQTTENSQFHSKQFSTFRVKKTCNEKT